jgi:hypothetical protein
MVELRERAVLARDHFDEPRVVLIRAVRERALERDHSIELAVVHAIHGSHSATPEQRLHAVA